MIRTVLCAVAAVVALSACGQSCPDRDGSIDGYCDKALAVNCRQSCADCVDEWVVQVCAGTCQVVDVKPAEGQLPHSDPAAAGEPAKWAVCK